MSDSVEGVIGQFLAKRHEFEIFMDGIAALFGKHPEINTESSPSVHSIKRRIKSTENLREKIYRKAEKGVIVNEKNCFSEITDYSGVRVLHLKQIDIKPLKSVVDEKLSGGDWILNEKPIAYTWDPEYEKFFIDLGCRCERKDSFYTSVHFVVRPRSDSPISCEIQMRTLFEEIWGEIDHQLNYPTPTTDRNCREQLLVLAKVVGAGSRLVSSIYGGL